MRVSWNDDLMYKWTVRVFMVVLVSGAVALSMVSWSVWDAQQHPCAVRVK